MRVNVRAMVEADVEAVLAWRNHPDVRRFMFSQQEIQLSQHRAWFERTSHEDGRHLLIFERDGKASGFVNLLVSIGGVADWGFYVDPAAPKGSGAELGECILPYAFQTLGLHRIAGQVLAFNEKSQRFHVRLGFQQEGILRQHYFDGEHYQDVYSYGLLASEWLESQRRNA